METQLPSPKRGQNPPIFGPFLLWPNGWMHQDATWYGGRPQPRRLCVRWGPSRPPLKGHSPQFLANVRWGQTAQWRKMPLGMEVNLGPGNVVLDEVAAPPKRGTASQFSVRVCCGQTARWMKMPLGTEVALGPGHIVLDGDPALQRKGHSSLPLFSAHVYCGHDRPS